MQLDKPVSLFHQHRFGVLFVLLFCVILIPPYFENMPWVGSLWRAIFTCVMLWALYTVAGSRRVMMLAVLVLIPTLSSTWLSVSDSELNVAYVDNLTNILYFGLICTFLARYIFGAPRVTLEVIYAAMCLYMVMAVLWAAIYTNLQLFYVDAFTFYGQTAAEAGIHKEDLFQSMLYYSFVTLSTLGYGDIIPVHRVAQNWAAMEAMIGQFFIAIVIARLVSMYTIEKTTKS
jgi:voltage-gated potassium channel